MSDVPCRVGCTRGADLEKRIEELEALLDKYEKQEAEFQKHAEWCLDMRMPIHPDWVLRRLENNDE